MYFTQHAIDRFRERWAGGLTHGHALRELRVLALSARPLKARTRMGDQQYQASDGSGIVFVCKRDGHGTGLVCVTVLPEPEIDPGDPAWLGEPA